VKIAITILVESAGYPDSIGDARDIALEMIDRAREYARRAHAATLELHDVSEFIPDAEDIIPS
jgi:hypothetical protein